MDWRRLRATLRFDGAAWRRFAELGCVYGPAWWKRGSPPVIAAIIFPSVRDFMHAIRTRHGFRVIYSDRSVFTGLPILQALRRDEIVGMQIEPWGPMPGSHEVEFCGRPTRFQLGPFAVARVAGAPIVPVFAVRTGIRRYQIRVIGRFGPKTPAETVAGLAATVRAYESLG